MCKGKISAGLAWTRTGQNALRTHQAPCVHAHSCLTPRRFRVVYRLVGKVYLMLVAGAACNTLWLLRLADAATRVLLAAARGVEVTPDKLATRYPRGPPPPPPPCPVRACCS